MTATAAFLFGLLGGIFGSALTLAIERLAPRAKRSPVDASAGLARVHVEALVSLHEDLARAGVAAGPSHTVAMAKDWLSRTRPGDGGGSRAP